MKMTPWPTRRPDSPCLMRWRYYVNEAVVRHNRVACCRERAVGCHMGPGLSALWYRCCRYNQGTAHDGYDERLAKALSKQ
jgi:hypothetical protein